MIAPLVTDVYTLCTNVNSNFFCWPIIKAFYVMLEKNLAVELVMIHAVFTHIDVQVLYC